MLTDGRRLSWQTRPVGDPVMYQRWQRLLFLHWAIEPAEIQRHLPRDLRVDTFDGAAYLGVVPFEMRNIRPCWSPAVPYISNFLELNLRTYVVDSEGRPGVYFFSLNADRWIACAVGRGWFHLPYHWSHMRSVDQADGWIDYTFQRRGTTPQHSCRYRYRPYGTPAATVPGTLEFFLVERYLLFTQRQGCIARGQVHHAPYQLQSAEVSHCENRLFELDGLPSMSTTANHVGYVEGVNVDVFALSKTP